MDSTSDLSFLAPADEVVDWRLVLLVDAAAGAGLLSRLPATAAEAARDLSLDERGVRAVLDALAVWDVVERDGDGRYRPGPAAPDDDTTATLRQHARSLTAWAGSLDDRLRGVPPEDRPGPGAMQAELFLEALGVTARKYAPKIVDACLARFPDAKRVLDLGGLHGEYSLEFTRRGLQATLQDLPEIIEVVEKRGHLAGTGIELFAGSFFETVPEGPFDLAFACGITHTFDADHNRALYQRLRRVVAPGGGIAVVTFLRNRNPGSDVFAVQMLTNAKGGDSHAEDEYRAWLAEAGFSVDDDVVDIPGRHQAILFGVVA